MKLYYSISIFFGIFLFTSCTSYYYSVLDSKDPYTQKTNRGEFVVGGDSLFIVFNFSGENAPINIAIHNKMSQPVFIDWRHSGISLNNEVKATFRKQIKIQGVGNDAANVDYDRFQTDPSGMTYIEPYSVLDTKIIEFAGFPYDKLDNDAFKDRHINRTKDGAEKEFKAITYDETNTPLFFKVYLTLYKDTYYEYEPIFFETDFYQSKLIKGNGNASSKIEDGRNRRGNFFYSRVVRGNIFEGNNYSSLTIIGGAVVD